MQLSLDFQSKVSIYAQIIEQVKALIAAGVLQPGDQLPTVREAAVDLQVNFNTVARAYRLLHEAGMISTQQGRGTYVLGRAPAESLSLQPRHAQLVDMVNKWLAEAQRLDLRPEEVGRAWEDAFATWARARGDPD